MKELITKEKLHVIRKRTRTTNDGKMGKKKGNVLHLLSVRKDNEKFIV